MVTTPPSGSGVNSTPTPSAPNQSSVNGSPASEGVASVASAVTRVDSPRRSGSPVGSGCSGDPRKPVPVPDSTTMILIADLAACLTPEEIELNFKDKGAEAASVVPSAPPEEAAYSVQTTSEYREGSKTDPKPAAVDLKESCGYQGSAGIPSNVVDDLTSAERLLNGLPSAGAIVVAPAAVSSSALTPPNTPESEASPSVPLETSFGTTPALFPPKERALNHELQSPSSHEAQGEPGTIKRSDGVVGYYV